MTTGRINQVCQMLLLTALFHERMDERSQTAARNSKLFTTQRTALEHAFKALPSKRNSLLDARRTSTCAPKRRRRHQPPAPAWNPTLRQESLYPESSNDHKVLIRQAPHWNRHCTQDQTPTRGSESPGGFPDPDCGWDRLAARAAPLTSLYITGGCYPTAPPKIRESKNRNSFFKPRSVISALGLILFHNAWNCEPTPK